MQVESVRGNRTGAIAGAAFALFYLIGTAILNAPIGGTDAKILAWWSESGHQRDSLISMYGFALAGLAFIVFFSHLRSRLIAEGVANQIAAHAGLIFVGALYVSAVTRGVVGLATTASFGEPRPHTDLLRYLPQLSYAAGALALLAAALAIGTTSWVVFRTRVVGRWLAWVGFAAVLAIVVANAALAGVLVIPVMLIWALASSLVLWRLKSSDQLPRNETQAVKSTSTFEGTSSRAHTAPSSSAPA